MQFLVATRWRAEPLPSWRGARLVLLLLVGLLPVDARAAVDPVERLVAVRRTAKDFKQRLAAVIGLARLGTPRSVPGLIEALRDEDATVRGAAASGLGKLGDARARQALEALLRRETETFVIGQAQSALGALLRGSGAPASAPAAGSQMQVDGTLGSLDEQAAQDGVNGRLAQAMSCFRRELQSAPYLDGKIELGFRVAADGKVKWVHLRRNELGSLAAEQCILAEMRQATFSAPEGGEAEFSIPLRFEGRGPAGSPDGGAPTLPPPLAKSCGQLMRPDAAGQPLSLPAGLQLTLYVDSEGAVLSAGLAAEGEIPAQAAQELVSRLKTINLGPPPGGGTAKIMAPFPCLTDRAPGAIRR